MTDFAYRLGLCSDNEISFTDKLKKQIQCYLAALQVIQLIDDDYAWIESAGNFDDLDFPPASPKRKREGDFNYSDHPSYPNPPPRTLRTLKDLKKSYALASSLLTLSNSNSGFTKMRNEQDTLTLLIDENYIDKAILLAKLCDKQTEFFGMSSVFKKLINNILNLQNQNE